MARKVSYVCPVCKTHNREDESYCTNCGQWLNSTTFPARSARRKSTFSGWVKKIITSVVGFIGLCFIISAMLDHGYMKLPNSLKDYISRSFESLESSESMSSAGSKLGLGEKGFPVPLGKTLTFGLLQQQDRSEHYYSHHVSIQVNEVVRGEEALSLMIDWGGNAEKLSALLGEGQEYLLAYVTMKNISAEKNVTLNIDPQYLNLRDAEGNLYEPSISQFSNLFQAKIEEGTSESGWFSFITNKEDLSPFLEVVDLWFKTN